MLLRPSGRFVPAKPGCVGVKTLVRYVVASKSAKGTTVCGPPPPCRRRTGCPMPRSSSVTSTGVGSWPPVSKGWIQVVEVLLVMTSPYVRGSAAESSYFSPALALRGPRLGLASGLSATVTKKVPRVPDGDREEDYDHHQQTGQPALQVSSAENHAHRRDARIADCAESEPQDQHPQRQGSGVPHPESLDSRTYNQPEASHSDRNEPPRRRTGITDRRQYHQRDQQDDEEVGKRGPGKASDFGA